MYTLYKGARLTHYVGPGTNELYDPIELLCCMSFTL